MSNCKVIGIVNQKGGVSKTTTTANLGIGLAMQGKKVCLLDLDPQASLTISLGWNQPDELPITIMDHLESVMNRELLDPSVGILHHPEGVALRTAEMKAKIKKEQQDKMLNGKERNSHDRFRGSR